MGSYDERPHSVAPRCQAGQESERDFDVHLHFAQSFSISALNDLNNAVFTRSYSSKMPQSIQWAREHLAKALKAIDAFERQVATGTTVEADYIG